MVPEFERVKEADKVVPLRFLPRNPLQQLGLNLSTITIMRLTLAHLDGHQPTLLLHIAALNDAAEGPMAKDSLDLIPVPKLLACMRLECSIRSRRDFGYPESAYRIDCLHPIRELFFFVRCQPKAILDQGLFRVQALELLSWRS